MVKDECFHEGYSRVLGTCQACVCVCVCVCVGKGGGGGVFIRGEAFGIY